MSETDTTTTPLEEHSDQTTLDDGRIQIRRKANTGTAGVAAARRVQAEQAQAEGKDAATDEQRRRNVEITRNLLAKGAPSETEALLTAVATGSAVPVVE